MAIRSECAAIAPEHIPNSPGKPAKDRTNAATAARRYTTRQRLRNAALAGAAAAVLVGSTGCSMLSNAYKQIKKHECLDDFMIAHRNRVFAAKAWYREQHCHRNRHHLDEFKAGFIQGYIDIANGGNGCTPCVAPDQYWGWRYQSPDGHSAINAWFAGYPLGAKAAEQDGVGYWGQVHYGNQTASTADTTAGPDAAKETDVTLGPDGRPLMKEMIVPGSARVLNTGERINDAELRQTLEMLQTPAADAVGHQPTPAATPQPTEEAFMEVPAETLVPQPEPGVFEFEVSTDDSTVDATDSSVLDQADDLVPRGPATQPAAPRTDAPTYSLGDLEDDAIEGIFGATQREANAETANANNDIPFKFE